MKRISVEGLRLLRESGETLKKEIPNLRYSVETAPLAAEVASVLRRAGLARPVDDLRRIGEMIDNSDLIVTARDGEKLIGLARSITDCAWCCYLSDLAVDADYQCQGIGRELIRQTREVLGPEVMVVLIATDEAMSYYDRLGFRKCGNAWVLLRDE